MCCVYVKDTSRSTETGECVCVYLKDTSRSTETVCVFSQRRVDLHRQDSECVCVFM